VDGIDVARSACYPRLDLNASVGRDNDRITSRLAEPNLSTSRTGVALNSFDGLPDQERNTSAEIVLN
jgi:outer membrane protein TolC